MVYLVDKEKEPYESIVDFLIDQIDRELKEARSLTFQEADKTPGVIQRGRVIDDLLMKADVVRILNTINPIDDPYFQVDKLLYKMAYPYRNQPGFNNAWRQQVTNHA